MPLGVHYPFLIMNSEAQDIQQSLDKFVKLVEEMRQSQKDFYRNRSQQNLRKAKSLEKQVDLSIEALNELFADTQQLTLLDY